MTLYNSKMSSPTLSGLLKSHQKTIRTLSDLDGAKIVTVPGLRYQLYNVKNTHIDMNGGCVQLSLFHCQNITIIADRLPVMGVNLIQTDNARVEIIGTPADAGSGFFNLDHSVLGVLETDQDCMVQVNECIGITLNGTNISDRYHDSTWRIEAP